MSKASVPRRAHPPAAGNAGAQSNRGSFKTNKIASALPKAEYSTRLGPDENGQANIYAIITKTRGLIVDIPAADQRDNQQVQLAASRIACQQLEAMVRTSPDLHNKRKRRRTKLKPFFAASHNPEKEMTPAQRAIYWAAFEVVQGLEGLPFIEWEHWKNSPRPPHQHRLYPRISVNGDGRIFATNNDWPKNEAANAVAAYQLRDEGFTPLLGPNAPAVYTILISKSEWHGAAKWYVAHIRQAMETGNHIRAEKGATPIAIPADNAEAMRLYRKHFSRAAGSSRAKQQEKHPDCGGDRSDIARDIIPILDRCSSPEQSASALTSTQWQLAAGDRGPVLLRRRDPKGGSTGAMVGVTDLYRLWLTDTTGDRPEERTVWEWVHARTGTTEALPSSASVRVDPEIQAIKEARSRLQVLQQEREDLNHAWNTAGKGKEAGLRRIPIEKRRKELKREAREISRVIERLSATRVETTVLGDEQAHSGPWMSRGGYLELNVAFVRGQPQGWGWQAIGEHLRDVIEKRTSGQGGVQIFGGAGGMARADLVSLALVRTGYPADKIINVAQSPDLREAASKEELWRKPEPPPKPEPAPRPSPNAPMAPPLAARPVLRPATAPRAPSPTSPPVTAPTIVPPKPAAPSRPTPDAPITVQPKPAPKPVLPSHLTQGAPAGWGAASPAPSPRNPLRTSAPIVTPVRPKPAPPPAAALRAPVDHPPVANAFTQKVADAPATQLGLHSETVAPVAPMLPPPSRVHLTPLPLQATEAAPDVSTAETATPDRSDVITALLAEPAKDYPVNRLAMMVIHLHAGMLARDHENKPAPGGEKKPVSSIFRPLRYALARGVIEHGDFGELPGDLREVLLEIAPIEKLTSKPLPTSLVHLWSKSAFDKRIGEPLATAALEHALAGEKTDDAFRIGLITLTPDRASIIAAGDEFRHWQEGRAARQAGKAKKAAPAPAATSPRPHDAQKDVKKATIVSAPATTLLTHTSSTPKKPIDPLAGYRTALKALTEAVERIERSAASIHSADPRVASAYIRKMDAGMAEEIARDLAQMAFNVAARYTTSINIDLHMIDKAGERAADSMEGLVKATRRLDGDQGGYLALGVHELRARAINAVALLPAQSDGKSRSEALGGMLSPARLMPATAARINVERHAAEEAREIARVRERAEEERATHSLLQDLVYAPREWLAEKRKEPGMSEQIDALMKLAKGLGIQPTRHEDDQEKDAPADILELPTSKETAVPAKRAETLPQPPKKPVRKAPTGPGR
jgi:hypothetical protein